MFLTLNHINLEVYKQSYALTMEAYKITRLLPESEKFNLISQIRRAALSVHLNLAEGSSRKSVIERRRYYEIARGSIIEIDSALDITVGLEYVSKAQLIQLGEKIISTFKLLSGMIGK